MYIQRETRVNEDFFELIKKVDILFVKSTGREYILRIYKKRNNKEEKRVLMFCETYHNTNYSNNNKTLEEIFGKAYKNSKKGKFISDILDKVNNFGEYKKQQEHEILTYKLESLKQQLADVEQKFYDITEEIQEVEYQLKLNEK